MYTRGKVLLRLRQRFNQAFPHTLPPISYAFVCIAGRGCGRPSIYILDIRVGLAQKQTFYRTRYIADTRGDEKVIKNVLTRHAAYLTLLSA